MPRDRSILLLAECIWKPAIQLERHPPAENIIVSDWIRFCEILGLF
jgi:hypothetical protein